MVYFIVPVYKVENYLRRCAESILNQTFPDVHLVLVDDGSPDNCPVICDEYAKNHTNVTVIHKENGGLSDARNFGIEHVLKVSQKNDFITFVDSDDFVREDYAEVLTGLCEEYKADVIQCGYEKGYDDSFSSNEIKEKHFVLSSQEALLDQRLKSQSCAKLYSVSVFENVRYPKGVLNEDEFTTWKLVYNGKNVLFTDLNLYYYFQHQNSIMDSIARKLKGNPHRFDWLKAYEERIAFFKEKNDCDEQVMRTYEKICTDIILRYTEQMWLPKDEREESCVNGEYILKYRDCFKKMFPRKGISIKRRMMYIGFYIFPQSAVIMGKIFGLRK